MTTPLDSFRWCLVAATVAWTMGGLGAGWVRAEDPPAGMPAATVTKITEMLKKAAVLKRKSFDTLMHDEIATGVKETGLGTEGSKALEAAAVKAEEAAQEDFVAGCWQKLREVYAKDGEGGMAWADRQNAPEFAAGPNGLLGDGAHLTGPLDQLAWKEAVARVLTPEQIAVWGKGRAERKKAVDKAVADFVDKQIDRSRQQLEPPILTQSGEIRSALDLSKERGDELTALAKKATDASVEAWRQAATKSILSKDEPQRNETLKNKNFYFQFNDKDAPDQQAVWTEGLAKLLTDADRARLQTVRDNRKARRVHAVGQLIVAILDEKIAFTSSQRPRLEPIVEKLAQPQKDFFPIGGSNNYYALSLNAIYKTAAKAKGEDLRPILDDLQRKHWEAVGHYQNVGNNYDDEDEFAPSATPGPSNPDLGIGEPEDLEQVVSDYLQTRAAAHYKALENVMVLAAEDAARVAGLETPRAARLQTAARGAAEATLAAWEPALEQNARSEIKGATAENIRQKVANGARYYYERLDPRDKPVWKAATNAELTPPQQAAWQTERDARSRYNDNAVAGFLLAEFDRRFSLRPEQWDKLAPIMAQALQEYQTDLRGFFSYSNTPWYLSYYYMFLPIQSVPESDLKALLSAEQWDRWSGSREYGYTASYWTSIRQNHDARAKQKTP